MFESQSPLYVNIYIDIKGLLFILIMYVASSVIYNQILSCLRKFSSIAPVFGPPLPNQVLFVDVVVVVVVYNDVTVNSRLSMLHHNRPQCCSWSWWLWRSSATSFKRQLTDNWVEAQVYLIQLSLMKSWTNSQKSLNLQLALNYRLTVPCRILAPAASRSINSIIEYILLQFIISTTQVHCWHSTNLQIDMNEWLGW